MTVPARTYMTSQEAATYCRLSVHHLARLRSTG